MSRPRRLLVLFVAVSLNAWPSAGHPKTWKVARDGSGNFYNIRDGVFVAAQGDTVIVAAGIYRETVYFQGRDVCVLSTAGPSMTVIDGSATPGPTVRFTQGETNACLLSGFTITGGSCDASYGLGGGVEITNSSPTIIGNIIEANTSSVGCGGGAAGGIRAASFPLVFFPRILNNTVRNNRGYIGGGIGLVGKVSATVSGNEISNNEATADGGGISCTGTGSELSENVIHHNLAHDHGGGINFGNAGSIKVFSNVVYANEARHSSSVGPAGAGIRIGVGTGEVYNNTIVGNMGRMGQEAIGAGIGIHSSSTIVIKQNLVALNKGEGILCDGSSATIKDNLAWGNTRGDGGGMCPSWFMGEGNLQADPLFCDAENGDFSLPANSPALTHPAGSVGALKAPGCQQGTPVGKTTWSRIKTLPGK